MYRFSNGILPRWTAFGCKLPKAPDADHIAGVVIPDTGSDAKALATLTGPEPAGA
jgi:hypothetical protein